MKTIEDMKARMRFFQEIGQELSDHRWNGTPIEVRLARIEMVILGLISDQMSELEAAIHHGFKAQQ